MKILVCISCVPDTTSKISFIDNKSFNSDGVQYIIGPYEDYALARAVELKESNSDIDISVINVGKESTEPILRKALAIGADRAYRINLEPKDSISVAKYLKKFIEENSFDLILMGKESIDYNSGNVHHLVGAMLNITSFSPVTFLEVDGDSIIIKRETDIGIEKIKTRLPLVLGCQEPIAEWKIPNMRGIMNARSKELKVLDYGEADSVISFNNYNVPTKKEEVKFFDKDDVKGLIDELKLKNI